MENNLPTPPYSHPSHEWNQYIFPPIQQPMPFLDPSLEQIDLSYTYPHLQNPDPWELLPLGCEASLSRYDYESMVSAPYLPKNKTLIHSAKTNIGVLSVPPRGIVNDGFLGMYDFTGARSVEENACICPSELEHLPQGYILQSSTPNTAAATQAIADLFPELASDTPSSSCSGDSFNYFSPPENPVATPQYTYSPPPPLQALEYQPCALPEPEPQTQPPPPPLPPPPPSPSPPPAKSSTNPSPEHNRLPKTTHTAQNALLLHWRSQGVSYKTIRTRLNLTEAESTLRGRLRTLTKPKCERLRRPQWLPEDVGFLIRAVEGEKECGKGGIKWKRISEEIVRLGGRYRFGPSTCKKRYLALVGEGVVHGFDGAETGNSGKRRRRKKESGFIERGRKGGRGGRG
ncbi:hypothetical protein HOY82DRAFT_632824 [Tuber indicum]|nr:hypothetical protein HOY82DRAFT_632824 [Tuber indicum]